MQPVLFDSSIYITAMRMGDGAALALRRLAADSPLEELYAGVEVNDVHVVERLERDFDSAQRTLVPNLSDWTRIGKVLSQLAAKYDYEKVGRGRLTNDELIAMSAGRLGITVITANGRDFSKLAEFRPFPWRVNDPRRI
jgi:predicted nucleic acid-binding protein